MKEFILSLDTDVEELIHRAKETVERHGGQWQGDHHSGRFSGQGLEAEYRIEDRLLRLGILKKPFFLSWSMIESILTELLGQQPRNAKKHDEDGT